MQIEIIRTSTNNDNAITGIFYICHVLLRFVEELISSQGLRNRGERSSQPRACNQVVIRLCPVGLVFRIDDVGDLSREVD